MHCQAGLFSIALTAILCLAALPAAAEDCVPASFVTRVERSKTIVAGEILRVVQQQKSVYYAVKILRVLKRGQLLAKGQRAFLFPKKHTWEVFHFKPGQVVLFFFDQRFDRVSCNEPIPLTK